MMILVLKVHEVINDEEVCKRDRVGIEEIFV